MPLSGEVISQPKQIGSISGKGKQLESLTKCLHFSILKTFFSLIQYIEISRPSETESVRNTKNRRGVTECITSGVHLYPVYPMYLVNSRLGFAFLEYGWRICEMIFANPRGDINPTHGLGNTIFYLNIRSLTIQSLPLFTYYVLRLGMARAVHHSRQLATALDVCLPIRKIYDLAKLGHSKHGSERREHACNFPDDHLCPAPAGSKTLSTGGELDPFPAAGLRPRPGISDQTSRGLLVVQRRADRG